MDETEALITQLGLLLTQTRYARRSLEDIERATSTYGTFAFTSVIAAGPRFGEPPLFDGALKVHVVNLSDLAPGGGIGDFLRNVLAGVGSFVGNIPGGLIGGTIGSIQLLNALPTIDSMLARVVRIMELLGMGEPKPVAPVPAPAAGTAAPGPAAPATTAKDTAAPPSIVGETLTDKLQSIQRVVDAATALFLAASGKPDAAAGAAAAQPVTETQSARWLRLLDSTGVVLRALSRVVDGLIIALPVAVGALAWLIDRLPQLRLGIAETLQFVLRAALLVRGAVLVTAFDTLSVVARVASTVVTQLASTLDLVIAGLFTAIRTTFSAVLELGSVLGEGIKKTVDTLLNWMVPTVDAMLRNLADLRAFRVLVHVVRILPAILPPILTLKNKTIDATAMNNLTAAANLPFLAPLSPGTGGPVPLPTMPDFRAVLHDPALVKPINDALDTLQKSVTGGVDGVAATARTGLDGLVRKLDAAAAGEVKLSDTALDKHLGAVATQSDELAKKLVVPEAQTKPTGLEPIANAYEGWLKGGGLDTVLHAITAHFTTEPGRSGVPPAIAEGSFDAPRATVQIDEVLVEVTGPAGSAAEPAPQPAPQPVPVPEPDLSVLEPDLLTRIGQLQLLENERGRRCWPITR
jgi:hypothetical protein